MDINRSQVPYNRKAAVRATESDETQARTIIIEGLGELAIPAEVRVMQTRPRSMRKIIVSCRGRHFHGIEEEWPVVLRYAVVALLSWCASTGHRPTVARLNRYRKRLAVEGYQRMLVARGDPKVYRLGRVITPEEICPWAFLSVDSGHDDSDQDYDDG